MEKKTDGVTNIFYRTGIRFNVTREQNLHIFPHNGAWYSSEEAQLSHIGAQYSSEEAQLSKDSSKFSSYEAYVLPNYGVSAGKRAVYEVSASVSIGYHASSNHVGIPQKFDVSFDLKAE